MMVILFLNLEISGMEKKSKKDIAIFCLKIIAAVVMAVLSVFGVTSLVGCSSVSSFSMTADTLYMDNPVISVKDSTNVKNPF